MSTTTEIKKTDPLVINDYFKKKKTESDTSLYTDSKDNSKLGKEDFLNLLVTQLRYQDPLNPSDNQQMAAQMAQFSALEQTQNMAESLGKMGESIQGMVDQQQGTAWTMSSSAATQLLGKTVRLRQDETIVTAAGGKKTFEVTATRGSELAILDAEGNTVRTFALDGVKSDGKSILDANGDGVVEWDGKGQDGLSAPKGTYTLKVRNATTGEDSGEAWVDAVVAGVQFDSSGPQLVAGGQTYTMSDLLAVAGE